MENFLDAWYVGAIIIYVSLALTVFVYKTIGWFKRNPKENLSVIIIVAIIILVVAFVPFVVGSLWYSMRP